MKLEEVTIMQLALLLGIDRTEIAKWIDEKKLKARITKGNIYISIQDLAMLLAYHPECEGRVREPSFTTVLTDWRNQIVNQIEEIRYDGL